MSDIAAEGSARSRRAKRMPLMIWAFLALSGAGAGFYAAYTGLVPGLGQKEAGPQADAASGAMPPKLPDVTFVAVDPIMISLGDESAQHLRFRSQLEVEAKYRRDVEKILPRVVDVLNSYLRALDMADLRDPLALTRLRAQMLRRIQVVAGQGRVRDLLIMEFVLN